MQGKKRSKPVTDEQIIETYLRLRSARRTSQELGISETAIYRVLNINDIERTGHKAYLNRITRFQGQEREICQWYEDGASLAEIKSRLGGASDYSVKHAIRRAGGALRDNPIPTIKPGELETIAHLHKDGWSQAKIALELKRSQSFIWRVMRDNKIKAPVRSRESHGNWNGGRMRAGGYYRVLVELDDPIAAMRNNSGYVLEHRLVMARSIGRPLLSYESVHHINGDPADNRLENLQLRQGRHGKGVIMKCADCGSHNIVSGKIAAITED